MNDTIGRRRPIAGFIIKILIVLLFPLDGVFRFSHYGWISLLMVINSDPFTVAFPIFSLILGLLVMAPCLIFEQQINSNPISKSLRGRAVGAAILCWFISFVFPVYPFLPYEVYYPYTVQLVPVLSISFFIILPLISREATANRISAETRTLDYRLIVSTLGKKVRRERFLSILLWACLIFCPFVFYFDFRGWSMSFQFMSLFYQMYITNYGPIMYDSALFLDASIHFSTMTAALLPFMVLLSSLRFVFVRDVFRFQKGLVKKPRLASIAIVAEILPSAVIIFMSMFLYPPDSYFMPTFFPFPILPIIGFIFVRFSRITPAQEELWPEYQHRMWFEKERTPYTPKPVDESIKVPITYLLVSQIRKRLRD